MNGYKDMVVNARKKGVATEQSMWRSIDDVDDMLCMLKESHPEAYWAFMRKSHENIYGPHYDEEYAEHDIADMHSTSKDGTKVSGQHWSKDEIKTATQGKVFPPATTDCDKWVAYNAMWHDLHHTFSDSDILNAAYLFYFADEDAPDGKVWKYMCAMKH